MRLLTTTLILAPWALAQGAAVQRSASTQHETADAPQDWQLMGPADEQAYWQLSVALSQPRLTELKARLADISDIQHADYGAHLTAAQMQRFQKPDRAAVDSVTGWLAQGGVADAQVQAEAGSAWVHVNATVRTINALLDCRLLEFRTPLGRRAIRATEYSLPSDVAPFVQFVYPVTHFSEVSRRDIVGAEKRAEEGGISRRQSSTPKTCSDYVTPDCLVDMYNITYIPPDSASGSTLAIAGFLEEYPNQDSVHQFLHDYSPRRNTTGYDPNYNFTLVSINGGNLTDNGSGAEALLDTFYSMPFVQPLPVQYLSVGGRGVFIGPDGTNQTDDPVENANEPYLPFLEGLLAMDDKTLPKVVSISYTDDEQSWPRPYAIKICDQFMQLAARGVSVLAASGDGGAAGTTGQSCTANYGDNKGKSRFVSTFPASCPYVTAVGATALYSPPEPAWFSSGGFSEYFAAPAWQANDTAGYVAYLNGTKEGWYNASGRGVPDISLVGVRYLMGGSGRAAWTQKGTSASTPVVAAMVALVNDRRMRAGKSSLGFLNPVLYSNEAVRRGGALWDVVSGSSGGCTYGDGQVENGWDAVKGWDASSGLGTVDFEGLLGVLG